MEATTTAAAPSRARASPRAANSREASTAVPTNPVRTPTTRTRVTDSTCMIMPAMIRLKIGTSELRTAAVPESMYCSPQLMRKIGREGAIRPSTARGASSRGCRKMRRALTRREGGACQIDPQLGEVDRNLERIERWVVDAAQARASLVVLPEAATTGYAFTPLA